jgi:hypothetical protein
MNREDRRDQDCRLSRLIAKNRCHKITARDHILMDKKNEPAAFRAPNAKYDSRPANALSEFSKVP